VVFAIALPFLAIPACVWLGLDRLASEVAGPFVEVGESVARLTSTTEPTALPPTESAAAIAALGGDPVDAGSKVATPLPKPAHVFVSRARVLAAAEAGIRPSGTPVPKTDWRPAGLALRGVGMLGVGLRDGDVLVAASDGAIVGAVTAALRRGSKAVGGEVWRGRQKINLTVELPEHRAERDVSPAPHARRDPYEEDEASKESRQAGIAPAD
jgi:hypothetical protein